MKRLLRCLVLMIASAAIGHWAGGAALACERCLRLGIADFHHAAIGGDNHDDALIYTSPLEEGMGSAQFVLQGGKFPQPGGLGAPITITYSYNNLLDGGLKDINEVPLPIELIRGSIEEALGVWASHVPLHFVEVPDEKREADLFNYPDGQFGQIRFNHLYYNGPDIPGQLPTTKALARFPNSGGNYASDVYFDNGDPWQEVGTLPQPDILGAAIHEIGHTLGLGHSDDPSANMYWIFHRFAGLGTGQLFADDILGIQQIYGPGVGSVTPLEVPEPSAIAIAIVVLSGAFLLSSRRAAR